MVYMRLHSVDSLLRWVRSDRGGVVVDVRKVEKFILFDYIEPDVLWISSIWKVVLLRGLRRFLLLPFVWFFAFVVLVDGDVEFSMNVFIILAVSPIPIIAIASVIYHRQIIAKGCEKIYARNKNKMSNKDKNQNTLLLLVLPVTGAIFAFSRLAPEVYSAITPLVSFMFAIAAGVFGFVILFQICGQLYKIYLIKKHCPYLKTPADARHYIVEDQASNHITQ